MIVTVCHQYGERLGASLAQAVPDGIRLLELGNTRETAWLIPEDAEVLLVNQNSAAIGLDKDMARPGGWPFNLKWAHLRSTGIDKYPDWFFEVPAISVTRGGYAIPISEYVLAAMLSFAKGVPGIWVKDRASWHNHHLVDLCHKTLGIVGFGEIGKAVARRALAFDMTVLGTRRSAGSLGMDGVISADLPYLLANADHVVLCAPLTSETRGIIGRAALAQMKPGAHLINVGRGALIDTDALLHSLEGNLGGATLDVTDPEPLPDEHWLFRHPKARVSAHVSGSSAMTQTRANAFLLENLCRYLEGRQLKGLIDKDIRY